MEACVLGTPTLEIEGNGNNEGVCEGATSVIGGKPEQCGLCPESQEENTQEEGLAGKVSAAGNQGR